MKIEFTFDMSNCEFNIDKINEIVSYEIDKCCHDIEAEAKHLCPVDTGALEGSITTDNLTDTSGEVFTNMEYCEYVEYGTIHMSKMCCSFIQKCISNNRSKSVICIVRYMVRKAKLKIV